jgi:hypothetical protein
MSFSYALLQPDRTAWATLTIPADKNLSDSVPTFMEGTDITGSLELHLEHSKNIKSVTVSVSGRSQSLPQLGIFIRCFCLQLMGSIVTGGDTPRVMTFLQKDAILWTRNQTEEELDLQEGDYAWPFKFEMPKEVAVRLTPTETARFRLPHTFYEPPARASVRYELILRIARGGLKRNNKCVYPACCILRTLLTSRVARLRMAIGYFHDSRPGPSSNLRQLALQLNSPPLGPEIDPEGWLPLPKISMEGTLFGKKSVELSCTVSS